VLDAQQLGAGRFLRQAQHRGGFAGAVVGQAEGLPFRAG
jgi:hypothetical protein